MSYPFWDSSIGMMTVQVEEDSFLLFQPPHYYVWLILLLATVFMSVIVTKCECSKEAGVTFFKRWLPTTWYHCGMIWYQGMFSGCQNNNFAIVDTR